MSEYRTLQQNQSLNAEYERNKKEREMQQEIERLKKECATYMELAVKRGNIITKAIEYATKRQEWLMNCEYSKIGTHNYINFANEMVNILRGEE